MSFRFFCLTAALFTLFILSCESTNPETVGPNSDADADSDSDTDTDSDADDDDDDDDNNNDNDDNNDDDDNNDNDDNNDDDTDPITCIDNDSDWWCDPIDCNDNDSEINPGMVDIPENNIDENCDGQDSVIIDTDNDNPVTCQEAAINKTYIGCDFWPTVTYNPVHPSFEFAAAVANGGENDATVTVTRNGIEVASTVVAPGTLGSITLPWVDELKGPVFSNANGSGGRVKASVRVDKGAYHLESDYPVTVWQFNPLEYKQDDFDADCIYIYTGACLSVSNDASLLLPSTAMTGVYRIFGRSGKNGGDQYGDSPSAIAITAPQDDTKVRIKLSDTADIAAGIGVTAASAGELIEFDMDSGDVVQLLGKYATGWETPHGDISGSVVVAVDKDNPGTDELPNYKPIQVISLNPITNVSIDYADHMEETVLPAEVIGNKYIVTPPSGPNASNPGHVVRFFGSVDGTTLTYIGDAPATAPTTLNAGEVVEIARNTNTYIVESQDEDHPFAMASFMVGGLNNTAGGDPAMSMLVTPKQFRKLYTFLAPTSYMSNYADVLMPTDAVVTIDGTPVTGTSSDIGDGWTLVKVELNNSSDGVHTLESDQPVGLQVMGFGHATAYFYPGGLNLDLISDPIIIIQ